MKTAKQYAARKNHHVQTVAAKRRQPTMGVKIQSGVRAGQRSWESIGWKDKY